MYLMLKRFITKSISRQLMLGIALVHAVLMSIFVYDLVGRERDFMIEQSREQAIGLSETLSANGSSWLLANDFIGIEEVISSQSGFQNLRYAMFTDMTGKVLGFTDRDAVGQYLYDDISLKMLGHAGSTVVLIDDVNTVDIASPVFANDIQIGWARVAVSREGIHDNLQMVTRNGLLYTFIAIVVGIVFAWMMAKGLTQDIRKLLLTGRRVQEGHRDVDFKLDREDELGELSHDFSATVMALSENEKRFKFMLDNSPVAVSIATDKGKNLTYVNPTFEALFNAGSAPLKGKNPSEYYENSKDYDELLNQASEGQKVNNQLIEMKGSTWVLASYLSIPYEGKDAVLGWFFDITERKQAEEELQKLTRAVESSSSAVIMTDTEGNIEYVNPRFTELTGYSKQEIMSENLRILESGATSESTYADMWATVNARGVWKGEFQNRRKDGSLYWNRASTSNVKNARGENTHFISILDDVTHEYELSEKLAYQASHDALTGLVNRHEFERRAENLFTTIKQDKTEHALCFMDLDQFKVVNDTCGHIAGDEMLRQLSMLLQQVVRQHDTLARLGGDEFGVLIEHCSLENAHEVAESLQQVVQDYQFSWEGGNFKVGVSIGLVAITNTTPNLTELMKNADAACYMAKDLGRNRIHVYRTEDSEMAKRYGEMEWVERIHSALEENRLCLYAQPIVKLEGDKTKHYELLIRMINEDGETIPPGAFLPAAERYNLISTVDHWVIEQAFRILSENPVFLEQINFVSINLSGQSLTEDNLLDFVISQLKKSGVDGGKICFEITETAAISNLSKAVKFISSLKALGCRFALDDFGSGLSSFAYLKNLPVDYLKIDGMFVKDIVDDPIDFAMVKSINEIGQVMGMQTIAEFVETDEIKEMLRTIGVDYAQGYGVGKPQLLKELLDSSHSELDLVPS